MTMAEPLSRGKTEFDELIEQLLERIVDLETTVADLTTYHKPTGYDEAFERIEIRAREQRIFDRTGMTPDEIMEQNVKGRCPREIAVSKPDQPWAAHLESFYDEARHAIRDRAFAQIEHECQTPNAEKSS